MQARIKINKNITGSHSSKTKRQFSHHMLLFPYNQQGITNADDAILNVYWKIVFFCFSNPRKKGFTVPPSCRWLEMFIYYWKMSHFTSSPFEPLEDGMFQAIKGNSSFSFFLCVCVFPQTSAVGRKLGENW